jgi:hypothetical protein
LVIHQQKESEEKGGGDYNKRIKSDSTHLQDGPTTVT